MKRRLIFIAFIVALTTMALTAAAVLAGGNATGGNATGGNATGGNATGGGKPTDPVCIEGYDCPGDPYYGTSFMDQLLVILADHPDVGPYFTPEASGSLFGIDVSILFKGVSDTWTGDITVGFSLDIECTTNGQQFVPSDQHPTGEATVPLSVTPAETDKNGKVTVQELLNQLGPEFADFLEDGPAVGCQKNWSGAIANIHYHQVLATFENADNPYDKNGNPNIITLLWNCTGDGLSGNIDCGDPEITNPLKGNK